MTIRASRSTARLVVTVGLSSLLGCSSTPSSSSDSPTGGSGTLGGAAGSGATAQGGSVQSAGGSPAGGGGSTSVGSAGTASGLGGSSGGSAAVGGGQAAGGSSALGGGSNAGSGGKAAGGSAGSAGASSGGTAGSGGTGGPQSNITIWIAGDSTVATGGPCPIGWGGKFGALFNDKVTVTNSAVAGRSVRTWLYNPQSGKDASGECLLAMDAGGNPTVQAHWTAMLNGMKAGDYLFIQFGINDGDSVKGVGTCPRYVGVNAFKASYGVMAAAAKARGAQPIFVTPTANIACTGSKVNTGTREPYVTATKDAGTQFGVPVINLNVLSTTLYSSLGFCPIPGGGDVSGTTTGAVGTFFCSDHTHFDTTGAVQIAGLVAKALTDQGIALSAYLK